MKNKKLSQFLSVTLAILMCLLAFPVSVSAETTGGEISNTSGYDTLLIAVNMEYECTCNDEQKAKDGCGTNGMCYIIRLPDGSFIIYDGGWNDKTMCDRIYNILKTCSPAGAKDIVIGGWILTHPHIDHYGALQYMAENQEVYKNMRVLNVYRAFPSDDYLKNNNLFDKVAALNQTLESLVGKGNIQNINKNEDGTYNAIHIRGAVLTPVYAADSDFNNSDSNASSLVSTLTVSGKTMLFTGDMTATVAQNLLNDNLVPTADYYQIPHHGCEDVVKNTSIDAAETLKNFYEKTGATTLLLPASSDLYNKKQLLLQNAYWKGKNLMISNTTTVLTLKKYAQSAGAAWDGKTSTKPSGAGTAEDPYLIEKPSNLLWLGSQVVNSAVGIFDGKYFRLENDIDCGGYAMRLGSNGKYFSGIFDGNGYQISNFRITANSSPNALFAYLDKGATVKNLTVDHAYVTSNYSNASTGIYAISGGIAGKALGGSTIENCSVLNSEVIGNVGKATAGGIAGLCENSTVSNCIVSNTKVSAPFENGISGGIAGSLTASSTVTGCSVLSQSNITAIHYVGGIAGRADASTVSYCVVTDSTIANIATDTEQAKGLNFTAGGIVGYHAAATVCNCINYGTVSLTDVAKKSNGTSVISVGGVVGYVTTSGTVENCVNYGSVTGSTELTDRITVGGIVGRCRQVTGTAMIQNCYNFSTSLSATGSSRNCGLINGFINSDIPVTASDNASVAVDGIETAGDGSILFEHNVTSSTGPAKIKLTNNTIQTKEELDQLASDVWNTIKENRTGYVAILAVQETAPKNGVFTMRFLLGLDSLEYSNYKFIITTEYTQNGVRKVAKNGGDSLTTVYETILAGGAECSAVQLGANYLGAMVVSGVPADATDMVVTVQAYVRKIGNTADTLIDTVTYSRANQSAEEVVA